MSTLDWLQSTPVAETIGWGLLHFVWQGAAIAVLVAIGFRLLREASANARYVLGCIGLTAMLLSPVVTMIIVTAASDAGGPGTPGAGAVVAASALDRLAPAVPTLTVCWLAGVLLLQIRLVRNWSQAQILRRCGTRPAPHAWRAVAAELAERLDVRAPVRLLESALAPVPMMIGWLQPVILVPTGAFTGLTPAQLRSIIAHELTHVRRHDYLVNLAQAVVETVLFYHPAVWWLSGRIRVEREYCCDDVAVRVCGDALCYAQALAALEELRCDDTPAVLASTGGSLMDRIRRIAGVTPTPTSRPARRVGGWLVPALVAVSATTVVSAMALAVTTGPEAGVEVDVETAPIERVDVVGITREIGAEEAEMIAVLRQAGVDNEVLALVLEEIGADPHVLQAIQYATQREAYVDAQMESLRAGVAERLAAGRMTLAEAERHLALARHELAQRFGKKMHEKLRTAHPEAVRELEELHERVKTEVTAGRLTPEEATQHLHEIQERVHRELAVEVHERHPHPERVAEVEARLNATRQEVDRDLARGRITAAEARERLHATELEMAKRLRGEALRTHRRGAMEVEVLADLERAEVEYHEVEAALARAVEAGEVNETHARARLDSARARLHDLRAQVESRHAHADALAELEVVGQEEHVILERAHADRRHARLRAIGEEQAVLHARELVRLREIEHAAQLEHELATVREAEARAWRGALAREHAARRGTLSPADRAALRAGLDAARAKLELAAVEGRITPEEAARRREQLAKLRASLAEEH